ncbi:divergent polysaccharide deacetylase family protein, partial [Rhodospirillum rubrum]
VAPPVQTAPAPSETPAGEKGALPAEFRDLLASDGPGFVMEERLPDDAYVHKPQVKPTVKTAALAPVPRFPEGPAESSGLPWKTYGVAAGKWSKPAIALVIDDMGLDRVRTEKVRKLAGPLTLAYLAYADGLAGQMRGGRKAGHEILMHMPMEPLDAKVNPGPGALKVGLSDDEILTRLRRNLDGGAEFVGINNHMGSRFTADSRGMTLVMGELKKRGLLWLDSMTSANSVGLTLAEMAGVPHIGRTVFLDNLNDQAAVARQLAKLEAAARQHGVAVGIGHPRDGTIGALSVWLPALAAKGITLVPISALVTTKDAELAHARPSGKTASTSPSTD